MRVLFDLTSAVSPGGVARWARAILRELPRAAPDWRISAAVAAGPEEVPSGVETLVTRRVPLGRKLSMVGIDRRILALTRDRFDAVVGPTFVVWKGHGAAEFPVVHDLAFLRFPETLSRRNLVFLRRMVRRSVSRARAVITVSDAVASEIRATFDIDPALIHVVPGAADALPAPNDALPSGIPDSFFLIVGALEPRKNVAAALAAHDVLLAERPEAPPIVLVADQEWRSDALVKDLLERQRQGQVIWARGIDDAVLATLYAHAEALLFPSRYEGFGLPVLEAMSLGCPVVCHDLASLHEIGGDALWYADASDPGSFARSTEAAWDAPRSDPRLVSGQAAAAAFSWSRSASKLKAAIEEAVAGGRT